MVLKIGKVKLKNSLILAPMVDVTDLPYRLLCRKAGAALCFTEMLYSDAIIHNNEKTKRLMKKGEGEKPLGVQVTGRDSRDFEKLIPYFKKYDLIDINCGCPSEKLIGNEAGSFLLCEPEKIAKMIKILKKSGKPVTAKIRLGFRKNNVIEIARMIQEAGADAITIHARLAVQGYDVPSDLKQIENVREILKIPVIGNGDVKDEESAREMLKVADGAMIGRAAIGDPLIFKRILYYLKTGKKIETTLKENLEQFILYLKLAKKYKSDLKRVKYIGSKFLRGFSGAGKDREKIMQMKSVEEIFSFAKSISNSCL